MKVKETIINKLRVDVKLRMRIALMVGTGEQNVYVAVRANKDNGRMTKMDFLMAISVVLDIPVTEILEPAPGR